MPRPTPLRRPARSRLVVALTAGLAALSFGAAPASANTATLSKAFAGPITPQSTCGTDGTADNLQAAQYSDYCIAFAEDNHPATDSDLQSEIDANDLKSQVIDLPAGFSGTPDTYPTCTDAQFGPLQPELVNPSSDPDDLDLNDVACPADSQVGDAVTNIVARLDAGDVPLQLPLEVYGRVFNLTHTSNEVARLGIVLDPSALGIQDEPKVKIIARITLRPAPDVGLRTIIDDLPDSSITQLDALQMPRARRALSVRDFSMRLWGPTGHVGEKDASGNGGTDSQPRPFAFVGSQCGVDQVAKISGVAYDGTVSAADSAPYQLTGCGSDDVQFKPSAEYSTSENRPDVPTEATVKVAFGASTADGFVPSAVKDTTVTLPAGITLAGQIASGAAGLPLCTAAQFDQTGAAASTCPAATAVGTVSFTSPLLSDPLTGSAFLGPQSKAGALPDLYIEAQLGTAGDAPRVKLIGHLTVDPQGRIVTTLTDLPEVLVSEFALTFRGGDHAALVTPETCGTTQGALSATDYAAPDTSVDSTQSYTVDGDCAAAGGFAPKVGFALDSSQAGASSALTSVVARDDRSQRLGHVNVDLPAGMLANLKGVPECGGADAAAGTCPAATKVGSIVAASGVGPAPYKAPGDVFLTTHAAGTVAGLVFRVPVKFGDVDLGVENIPASVVIRPNDLGLEVRADVPTRFAGLPLDLQSLAIRLDRTGFPLSPTACAPPATTSTITSATGTVARASASLVLTGCAALPFAPKLAAAVNGQTGNLGRPNVQVQITSPQGSSALKVADVTLPKGVSFDLKAQSRACALAAFAANGCADTAKIGLVSGSLAITDEPLTGDLYLLQAAPGKTLPGIGLAFRGRFSGNVAGTSAVDPKTSQLVTAFDAVPDLPLTNLRIDVAGGTSGVLQATKTLCTQDSADFTGRFVAQSGKTLATTEKTVCGESLGQALAPEVQATLSHVAKGTPTVALTTTAPSGVAGIKQVDVTLPDGFTLDAKRARMRSGVSITKLASKAKATTKKLSARHLRVRITGGPTTVARILTRTNTTAIKSKTLRKQTSQFVIKLEVTYTSGAKVNVPVLVTPH